jgi:mannose-1-phosphate guanylyltransferase
MPKPATVPMRSSLREPTDDDGLNVDWTLALAGGDGTRLQDYVTRRFGRAIPKQYCCLLDDRSMLEHTLDRMNRLTPPSRTLTVIGSDHAEWATPQLAGRSDHVFRQPSARDTGFATYIALAMIMRWHPNAIVTIAPTDQYVAPESRYLEALEAARGFVAKVRDLVVLLGVAPTEPDPELGYIVLGSPLTEQPDVRHVAAFVEKPSVESAAALGRDGALWSTMVTCGSVRALWELGREAAPQLLDTLDSLVPLIGTEDEDDAIDYIYRARRPLSFSRDVCERAPHRVAAMSVSDIEWSDFGRADRVERVIARKPAATPA